MIVVGLVLLFVGVAELFVVVRVAEAVGTVPMLLGLLAFAAAGAWLVKREGIETFRRISEGLRTGRVPTTRLVEGFLVMAAGFLFLVPGFLTDALGLVLLVPPARRRIGVGVMGSIERRISRRIRVVGARFGGGAPFDADPFRSYRRPDEPGRAGRDGGEVWIDADEVIDLDAEEYFIGDPGGELEPPTREG